MSKIQDAIQAWVSIGSKTHKGTVTNKQVESAGLSTVEAISSLQDIVESIETEFPNFDDIGVISTEEIDNLF